MDVQFGTVLFRHSAHLASMLDKPTFETELHAKWVAAQDISRFQELLSAETEDGKYKILAQLLSHELKQLSRVRF
jgi:hypothetical protein